MGCLRNGNQKFKKTTDSQHNKAVASNLLDQNFSAEAPNEKWAADISYIWTAQGWLYLAVMLDLYSRRVIGWAVGARMTSDLPPGRLTVLSGCANLAPV